MVDLGARRVTSVADLRREQPAELVEVACIRAVDVDDAIGEVLPLGPGEYGPEHSHVPELPGDGTGELPGAGMPRDPRFKELPQEGPAVEFCAGLALRCFGTDPQAVAHFREAARAFVERRPPRFHEDA